MMYKNFYCTTVMCQIEMLSLNSMTYTTVMHLRIDIFQTHFGYNFEPLLCLQTNGIYEDAQQGFNTYQQMLLYARQ